MVELLSLGVVLEELGTDLMLASKLPSMRDVPFEFGDQCVGEVGFDELCERRCS